MNVLRPPHFLVVLLVASLALNVWQFLRPGSSSPAEGPAGKPGMSTTVKNRSDPMPLFGKKPDVGSGDEEKQNEGAGKHVARKMPPEQLSEEELIFGWSGTGESTPVNGEPSGKVSPQRLKELAGTPASQAERFRVHARLLLPGDRTLDFGSTEFAAGDRIKLERLREFPYPGSFVMARSDGPVQAGQQVSPITPTTPGNFEFRNMGLEIELDVTPAPGALVVGGSFRQTVFDGFARMPGEAFSPVWQGDMIFTDNKVLQPQFATRECPFVSAATAGEPVKVPVSLSFGQTFLELTCTPVE